MSEHGCCGGQVESAPEVSPSPAPQGACCPAKATRPAAGEKSSGQSGCCGGSARRADYDYRPAPYVVGSVPTPLGPAPRLASALDRSDRLGALKMRWGIGRDDYRVRPGLYAVGDADAESPVLVTANYKLTVDTLRRELAGLNVWLLVIDTVGINVWCAAGKGTFSDAEVARMVRMTRLAQVVTHRRLILPQLSAPGVAAYRLKEACGFRATYGPIRAADIPRFLSHKMKADRDMRTVSFTAGERLVLAPAEINALWSRRSLLAYAALLAVSSIDRDGISLRRGLPPIGAAGLAVVAGGGVTPLLLPWLPGRAFSLKGAAVGAGAALAADALLRGRLSPAARLTLFAGVPALASYSAMNFTGSTPITSPSGVHQEMSRALPLQIAGAALAVGGWLASRMQRGQR